MAGTTLLQLKYFTSVYRYGSVTKAAEMCFVTQPTITVAIQDLEADIETTLFFRNRNRLTPTVEGDILYEYALSLLRQADIILTRMKEMAQNIETIRIGIPTITSIYFAPSLISCNNEINRARSNIRLQIFETDAAKIPEMLSNHEIDIAIFSSDHPKIQRFDRMPIYKSCIQLCVNAKHPLAKCEKVTVEMLRNEPMATNFRSDAVSSELILEWFARHNARPNYKYYFTQASTVERLLQSNIAVALVRPEMQLMDQSIIRIPLEDPIEVEISVCWSKSKPPSNALVYVIEKIRAYFSY